MEDSSLSSSTTDTVQSEAAPVPQEAVQKEDSSVGSTSPSRAAQFTVTNSLLSTTILPEDEGGCLMFDVPAGSTVISEGDFQKLLADVTAASDDEARIQTVKEGKEGHLFSSQQIVELLSTTSCVKTRQAMVQSLGPRVKDLGESKAVLDVFENPADRAEAEAVFRQVAKMAITTGSMSPRSRSPKQVLQGKGGGARGNPLARTTGSPAGRPVSSSPALPQSPATADTTVPDEAAGTAGAASSVQEEQESVDGSSVGGLTAVSMEPVAPLLQSPLDTSVASSTTTSEEDTSSGTSPFAATEAGGSSTVVAVEGEEGNSNAALVGSSFATSLSSSYDSLGSLSTIESTASLYQQQQPPRARMPNALPPQPSPLKHQVLPEGEEVTPLPPASSEEPAPKQEEEEAEDAKKPAAEQVQQQKEEEEAEPEAAVTPAEPAAVAEPEEEEAGQPAVPAEKQPEKLEEEAAATTTAAEQEVAVKEEEEAEKEQAAVASKEGGEEAPQQEGAPRKSVMARFAGGVTPFGGPSSAPPPMPKPLGKQPPPPKKPLVDTVGGGNVVPPPVPALASTTTAAKTQVVGPDELVPYEELVERKREGRLDGLNPAALEDYVNDQDFATVFKMSRQEFQQLPKWKQKRAKQDAGLF